jgi:hypothetical protein
MRSFKEQLQDFLKDKSYKEKFKDIEFHDSNYLIEIFVYKTKSEGIFSFNEDTGEKFELIQVNQITGQEESLVAGFKDFTHVAKVLKVGAGNEKAKYKEGDCVLLNPFDVTGKAKNPEWALYEQFQHSIGQTPIVPKDLEEYVPALQARYLEYQFTIPEEYNIGTQNILTFLVPEYKIKAKYNVK